MKVTQLKDALDCAPWHVVAAAWETSWPRQHHDEAASHDATINRSWTIDSGWTLAVDQMLNSLLMERQHCASVSAMLSIVIWNRGRRDCCNGLTVVF